MDSLIRSLSGENWVHAVSGIQRKLKSEIFGNMGGTIIKEYRNEFEVKRQKNLTLLKNEFIQDANLENLDEKINIYLSNINKENQYIQDHINYNVGLYIDENKDRLSNVCPYAITIISILRNHGSSDFIASSRLSSIFNKVVLDSSKQSDKSNGGNAMEELVGAMLEAVGLREGIHYKTQHKSKTHSDTDFVFPYVDDYKDMDVQIFAAAQLSSNDRLRLVSGELKRGAEAFAITGNGLDASSKGLRDIGLKILRGVEEKNNKIVCYEKEIEKFKGELKEKSMKKKKNGEIQKTALQAADKLKILTERCWSFSRFAKYLTKKIGLVDNSDNVY